ncbi:carbon-nitrogen hydrolase [Dunaliella salina]|uniref:Carbon-nitrogen hydrolase n=2 Tax=Dunaliella salina TaxID=3046 RepID=A0ABQ7GNH4_DUNSA|nr:carbon-nitrogen hydrolase [Dunaliella salina]|eukprot:KAF5836133.1 carbon-nitrogen hydrolase [Dunaliella salina]
MRSVVLAACQHGCSPDRQANADLAESWVRRAAASGANVILPFFERANNLYFNSVAMVDADGSILGVYRKSHIPSGPGYEEKFYFAPGDTGFKVFATHYGSIGVAICWDQWFPEVARALVLQGAEVILYPTAIGTEPHDPTINSYAHWCRVQQGHAAANMVPIVASNRVGKEAFPRSSITFYGGSFVCGPDGAIVSQVGASEKQHGNPDPCPKQEDGFCIGKFDLDDCAAKRLAWGCFRDRRPDLYQRLLGL